MISSHSQHQTDRLISEEPNLIPLLDFMLVLLIMFVMLAGPIQHMLSIQLPKVAKSAELKVNTTTLTIVIKGSSQFQIGENQFTSEDDLKAYLQSNTAIKENRVINVAADKSVDLQTMLSVFSDMKSLGIEVANIRVNQ
ncbi:ExbD/TolR family protein [Fangia hongkongensis]|uniref:ExbD/TolR family protein n=1 Tax=Fangia hongkongensis TaxID=270495 RepID=UPI00036278C3|nr:biopolymer transporter ExbD [Fangia hongkongensis]MBK2125067.1 biopolymer transporter ExbD [Fangia hongkongensis]